MALFSNEFLCRPSRSPNISLPQYIPQYYKNNVIQVGHAEKVSGVRDSDDFAEHHGRLYRVECHVEPICVGNVPRVSYVDYVELVPGF